MLGKQIYNYNIIEIIGHGGMGTVYKAKHIHLNKLVAIKVLDEKLLYTNKEFRQRFENEAKILSHLEHENIVSVIDLIPEKGIIIMDYIEGIPLSKYLAQRKQLLSENEVKNIFKQILEGIYFAHKAGVVHRDLKLANIMKTPANRIIILDFGLAKAQFSNNAKLTQSGEILGTITYLSPEQVEGKTFDHRSDIYALGIILFRLLTLKEPYTASENQYKLLNKILNEHVREVREFRDDISVNLQQAVIRATFKNPNERFQDAGEFYNFISASNTFNHTGLDKDTDKANNIQ